MDLEAVREEINEQTRVSWLEGSPHAPYVGGTDIVPCSWLDLDPVRDATRPPSSKPPRPCKSLACSHVRVETPWTCLPVVLTLGTQNLLFL